MDCVADANPLALRLEGMDRGFPFFSRARNGRRGRAEQFRISDFHFSGLVGGRIVIWTPLEKEKTRIPTSQHSDEISSLSFSPDGRFLASTDASRKLIIWATEVNKKTEWISYKTMNYIQRYFRIGNPFTWAKEKTRFNVSRGCLRLRMSLTTN